MTAQRDGDDVESAGGEAVGPADPSTTPGIRAPSAASRTRSVEPARAAVLARIVTNDMLLPEGDGEHTNRWASRRV